ncbi:AraC family transcriptional regulator [Tropicimonas marinistellae]|uniref:AraC family transcriptional regulator n=1 Tax=Tropicimonas marinistellae TaxID=1739787 RepID=UPI00122DE139|nr:AraC family transcriptional regulator [Tropicimonas marinistellae]
MPNVVFDELGEKTFLICMADAALSPRLLQQRDGHVPAAAINRFMGSAARRSGDTFFTLNFASRLSVLDYGIWGEYVLQAPTLGDAIKRSISIIHLHSSDDRLMLDISCNAARFRHEYSERRVGGYPQVAIMAASAMLSVLYHYLGRSWSPLSMQFDFPRPPQKWRLEEAFNCPILFDHWCLEIEMARSDLSAPNPSGRASRFLTRQDVERAYGVGPPRRHAELVSQLLHQNLGFNRSSLEYIARTLRLGPRTLQRRLDLEGCSYRELLAEVKMQHAVEILSDQNMPVSALAEHLEYATPSHFARAFRSRFGVSPTSFRRRHATGS